MKPVSSLAKVLPSSVWARSILRTLGAGETLFRQGDRTYAVFQVEEGRVQLVRHTSGDRPVILHAASLGDMFAEAALFSGTYHCDAVASMPSCVRAYPKRELLASLRSDPDSAERFMAVLASQVQTLRARLEERNIRSARERTLHHLELAAGTDGKTVTLSGTLMELAAELGLAHEVLYRTVAALEKEGAIQRIGAKIVLRRPLGA